MTTLYEKAGQTVTVVVDRKLVNGVDPENGIGRIDEEGAVEVTGRLVQITVSYQVELDVNGHTVTFDVDDATEIPAPRKG